MDGWYDHSSQQKKIDCRSNKQHSEPYFEYDPNPIDLTKRKTMDSKDKPDAIVRHTLSPVLSFLIFSVSIYFLAKLIFLIYNDGNVINVVLNGYPNAS